MAKKNDSKSKPGAPIKPVAPAAPVKPAAKTAAKSKPVAAKAKPKAAPKAAKPKAPSYTQDDVARRAYYISEKRRAHGLPGDEHHDWIEAERQLAEESKPAKKAAKA
jgi:hypothetical protein